MWKLTSFLSSFDGLLPKVLPGFVALVLLAAVLRFAGFRFRPTNKVLSASWFAGLVLILACAAGLAIQHVGASEKAAIDVDMLVSRGDLVEIYLNDTSLEPRRLPVIPNQRKTYHFDHLPAHISLFRLDPTNADNARMSIHGIRFSIGDRTVQQLTPADISRWNLPNITVRSVDAEVLEMASTTDDPRMETNLSIALISPDSMVARVTELFTDSEGFVLLAMVCLVAGIAVRMYSLEGLREGALAATVICGAPFVVVGAFKLPGWPPPVRAAVGLASYTGYPKSHDYLAGFLLLVFCLAVASGFFWFERKPRASGMSDRSAVSDDGLGAGKWAWVWHVAVILLLLLYFQPDFRTELSNAETATYGSVSWDNTNGVVWHYLIYAGMQPLREFWFPYSGVYSQFLPLPWGRSMSMVVHAFSLWFLYLGFYRISGRRQIHALSVFSLILIPVWLGCFPVYDRYLLAPAVVFLYLPAATAKQFDWRVHLPFTASVAWAFFYEPTQVLYAGAGIVAHTVACLAAVPECEPSAGIAARAKALLWQRIRFVGVPALTGVLIAAGFYAANGMLPGLLRFEASVGDQAAYGAWPSKVGDWVFPALHPDTLFLFLFLLIACSFYRYLRDSARPSQLEMALLLLCSAGFLSIQKQITRPHGMYQVGVLIYVGLLLYGLVLWRERAFLVRPVLTAFIGFALALSISRGVFGPVFRRTVTRAPSNLAANLDTLLYREAEIKTANASTYAGWRFVGDPETQAAVATLESECGMRREDLIYVLGDDAMFYVLTGRPTPYIFNLYNASPIYEQERIVEWMEREQPRFVLWNPESAVFDETPNTVRVPLIYGYVARQYSLLRTVGRFQILTFRRPGQRADIDYWRAKLGDTVDLGHIPSRTEVSDFGKCDGSACAPILVVRIPKASRSGGIETGVTLRTVSGPFGIRFAVIPGRDIYVIPLQRLWFWSLVGSASPDIVPQDPRVQVAIELRAESRSVLY